MKNVLITGAAGFIGSNLTSYLLNKGYNVYGVDDLSEGRIQFLTSISKFNIQQNFYYMDFVDNRLLRDIIAQKFDVIFHLAAKPRVSYSVEHPIETNETNVTKTLSLIETSKSNIKRFVFSSSSSVYGDAKIRPTPESTQHNPKSPYALQKSIIEKYLQQYYIHYGFDSCCLRYFNVMGPNQLGSSPYATAVGAWLDAIKQNRKLRSDGSGEQTRDMCPVENVCLANYLAAECKHNLQADAFNIACGTSISNNQILQKLLSEQELKFQVEHAPPRAGDVLHTLADVTKAKTILGYEPVVQFWDALENTKNWYENFTEQNIDIDSLCLNPKLHKND